MDDFKEYVVVCSRCKTIAELVDDIEVYGESYGNKIYRCPIHTDMTVGCHDDGRPYGSLADRETGSYRHKVHKMFDPIWRSEIMTRNQSYRWLSEQMKIPPEKCHIGMFNKTQCMRAMYFIEKLISDKYKENMNEDKEA